MTLIINGIDFDKRCDVAKELLHYTIDWHAQCLGIAKYFDVKMIVQETPEALKRWQEIIAEIRNKPFDRSGTLASMYDTPEVREEQIAVYVKHMERWLAVHPYPIHFELIRIK